MNLVEIYDYEMEQLLEREKTTRNEIKTLQGRLDNTFERLYHIQKQKQELKEALEDNLRFWGK